VCATCGQAWDDSWSSPVILIGAVKGESSRVRSVLPIGAEVLSWKITVKGLPVGTRP
jgi:hypothetical protein